MHELMCIYIHSESLKFISIIFRVFTNLFVIKDIYTNTHVCVGITVNIFSFSAASDNIAPVGIIELTCMSVYCIIRVCVFVCNV